MTGSNVVDLFIELIDICSRILHYAKGNFGCFNHKVFIKCFIVGSFDFSFNKHIFQNEFALDFLARFEPFHFSQVLIQTSAVVLSHQRSSSVYHRSAG